MKFYRGPDRKEFQNLLRDKGFYSTEGRLALLSLLKKNGKPLSAAAIARSVRADLDEANVYRSLEALTEKGLLTRFDVRRGGAHYEFAHAHHHHVVCSSCGKTEDVDICDDKRLEARALKRSRSFSSIRTHSMEFFGTCGACSRGGV